MKTEYQISIRWRGFPLHPEIPEEGMSIEELFADRRTDMQEMRRRLGKRAEDFGVPFRGNDKIYNSRLAQELALWSDSKNRGDRFHAAVFKAYFVDRKNIASIPVLLELASSVGLPEEEGAEILTTRAFKAAVDADWSVARQKSIRAVPTFVLNQDRVVGAQTYEVLEGLMGANGVKKRAFHSD